MSTTSTPNWSESLIGNFNSSGQSVSLGANATVVDTVGASTKYAVRFLIRVGRTATTALTGGVQIRIRAKNALTGAGVRGEAMIQYQGQLATAQSTTCSGSDSNSGQPTVNVASTTSWAVGDQCVIGAGTAREEWGVVARVTSATALLLDANLQYAHTTAQADTVINRADFFVTPELPGTPSNYEIVADNGQNATGVRVWAAYQSMDSVTTA